ncbi:MAG: hypothetical protein V2I33_24055, partial [Kangiellaceae bacterium]|nr:hypothetical protein [Kangiellaceae bacterium]
HNIICYSNEDRTQTFYPGMEGTIRISTFAVSPMLRYMAVAEEAERAVVFVYDLRNVTKKRKVLTTADI